MARWSISWALAVWGLAERGKGVKREPADNVCTTANVVKIRRNITTFLRIFGASGVTRTPDLLITNQLLYRLSYTSVLYLIELTKTKKKCPLTDNQRPHHYE